MNPSISQLSNQIDKRRFAICIAGLNIEVSTVSTRLYDLYAGYRTSGVPDYSIRITSEDIGREIRAAQNLPRVSNEKSHESIALLRKLLEDVIDSDVLLIHGAAVAVGNDAWLFSAPSGTGKTTHIQHWLEHLPDAYVINGDKPLLRFKGTETMICGSPWCGKERLGTNAMVPLRAIAFMKRGEKNRMKEISFSHAYRFLLQQTYLPYGAEKAEKALSLLSQMNGSVRFYEFLFDNYQPDCCQVAYKTLKGS